MVLNLFPYQMLSEDPEQGGKSKWVAFILSLLLGEFGADWFFLSNGDAGYIVAGIFKLLTLGGFGLW